MTESNTPSVAWVRRDKLMRRHRTLMTLSITLLAASAIMVLSQIFELGLTTVSPLVLSLPALFITYYAGRVRRQAEQIHT